MRGHEVRAAEIGERIKQARLEQGGMKQRELADLLGVSERSVIAYESGEVIPYRFMRDLERALGKPSSWILHGDNTPVDTVSELREEMSELTGLVRNLIEKLEEATGGDVHVHDGSGDGQVLK